MSLYEGACHCGAVIARFETETPPEAVQVRACQCGFCRRRGAKTISDPMGRLTLDFTEDAVERYRFASRSADFLICKGCGDYMAAVMESVAVLNVVAADIRVFADRAPEPVTYDAETEADKRARRLARWTPLETAA